MTPVGRIVKPLRDIVIYENRHTPPLPARRFALRLATHIGAAIVLIALSLVVGMWGYEHFEHLPWRDAFLNTAMLLGGMGPVDPPKTDAGKMFAGIFALYAGGIFLVVAGLFLVPVIHRVMHVFHWEDGTQRSGRG